MRLIFKDRFWFMHISFVSMVKRWTLELPVDHIIIIITSIDTTTTTYFYNNKNTYYYYYYYLLFEFFTSALLDGHSLEFEWQISSSLQDSSQYSGRSH